jgi:hypothetical protein
MMRKKNNGKYRHNNNGSNNGGRRHSGGGGGHNRSNNNDQQNLARQKHHATQMREKYQNMARDAQSNGDRVDAEYYLQHVDHYVRVLTDISAIEAERYAAYREQQAANGEPEDAAGDNQGGEPADAQAATSGGDAEDAGAQQGNNQPRMTRHPRRNAPQESAAPQVSKEIPLPASMLTEIQA